MSERIDVSMLTDNQLGELQDWLEATFQEPVEWPAWATTLHNAVIADLDWRAQAEEDGSIYF